MNFTTTTSSQNSHWLLFCFFCIRTFVRYKKSAVVFFFFIAACTHLSSQLFEQFCSSCKFTCCKGDLCNKATPEADTTTMSAVSASVTTPLPTNVSSLSNTTSSRSTKPPSAGVPEFTATFGAICLGFALSSTAALE